ncbi:MAG: orotidine-5'-phosphate decarboxylase [SAR202 cluster bacterium]|nr:orotidine-5'-phosphate decarboxylase [SAR202 cluster bacterium]
MSFQQRLAGAHKESDSLVCLGMDPDPALMPIPDMVSFNKAIVDATKDLVCAYKPNLAFFEAYGIPGLQALEKTLAHIRAVAPDALLIGDAKRGDVGHASQRYAHALFEVWGFDAATVNAYGGGESIEPFLEREDKGVFVWCRSSNPGAAELQDLKIHGAQPGAARFFERVAQAARSWNTRGNVGLVVGATYPEELAAVRRLCPDMPILLPGVGAQGGALQASVKAGVDTSGRGLLVSSSRGILYASKDPKNFASAARSAAELLRTQINDTLHKEHKRP